MVDINYYSDGLLKFSGQPHVLEDAGSTMKDGVEISWIRSSCGSPAAGPSERHDLHGAGVRRPLQEDVRTLIAVAEEARSGEVFGVSRSSVLAGDYVVDLVGERRESLWKLAVLAAMLGSSPNDMLKRGVHWRRPCQHAAGKAVPSTRGRPKGIPPAGSSRFPPARRGSVFLLGP